MKRTLLIILIILVAGIIPLSGHSLNLKMGTFFPSMKSDLWDLNRENLTFDKDDLRGAYYGAEFEVFMGRKLSLALEAGHYKKKAYSIYRDVEYEDGAQIEQDIFLRINSLEMGFKLYPAGHRKQFNPFIGGGVGLYAWRYVQGGEFVDFEEETVYEGEAETDTHTIGFNAKAGFTYRFRRNIGFSLEGRYVFLKGELSDHFEGFNKLDLGGLTLNVGLNFYFR
ncbi:MAG: outer membrane beta-barrel protein [bacterium]|nr:outer membrane beta-barrel protein [bacterium]